MYKGKVSVIICAHSMDRLNDTHEAIQSVLAQTAKPHELIISVDHNEKLFETFKTELPEEVKVVLNQNARGLSDTRNTGTRSANGDIVAFIDDDAVAEKTWLENLCFHFDKPQVVAVGGKAIPQWLTGKAPIWFPEEFYWTLGCTYKGLPSDEKEVRNVLGCNMAFRKEIFDKVGYFRCDIGGIDDTPRGGEEADLCLKIKASLPDSLILYESSALIYHKVPASRLRLSYIIKRCYNDGFYKRQVEKSFHGLSKKALSTENTFLRYLLFSAIPERLKGFYRRSSLSQATMITACTVAGGMGYLKAFVSLRN